MKVFKRNKPPVQEPIHQVSKELIDQIAHQRGNTSENYPSDFSAAEISMIRMVKPYTMTSVERLVSLYRSIDYIEDNNIEGDIVECGVWKGGSMMLAGQRLAERNSSSRRLFLFDTFEGMSEPSENDKTFDNKKADNLLKDLERNPASDNIWCYSTIDEVKGNLAKIDYNQENIIYIKGKVEDTLPFDKVEKIAILRLDTDWYESTKHELECLYDKLVVGGILIIDDYGHWDGAKKAVDEFVKKRKITLMLTRIDYTGRLAIKLNY